MQGIVSIIESNLAERIKKKWDDITINSNLLPVKPLIPHFSWCVAENFNDDLFKKLLTDYIENIKKFTILITGLGLFSGTDTVFYLPIVVSQELLDLHKGIWQIIDKNRDSIKNLSNYYQPSSWIPHITLIHQKSTFPLRKQMFEWIESLIDTYTIGISNISLIDIDSKVYFKLNF